MSLKTPFDVQRERVAAALREAPELSDRQIGRDTEANYHLVAAVRGNWRRRGQFRGWSCAWTPPAGGRGGRRDDAETAASPSRLRASTKHENRVTKLHSRFFLNFLAIVQVGRVSFLTKNA
jgi:hypothetical protein